MTRAQEWLRGVESCTCSEVYSCSFFPPSFVGREESLLNVMLYDRNWADFRCFFVAAQALCAHF